MTKTKDTTIINRLLDPFSIYSFLTIINSVLMLILYYVLPIMNVYNYEAKTFTYYYWDGSFQKFDYNTWDLIATGNNATHPFAAHNIVLISIIFLLVIAIAQILIIALDKKLTKIKFLSYFILPTFGSYSLMLFGVFTYVNWIESRSTTNLNYNMGSPLIYILLVGVLITIIVIGFAAALTTMAKAKREEKIPTS